MSDTENVHLPPHSVEAEEAVLGSALIAPQVILRVSPLLRARVWPSSWIP
jgi:replicative DNA helicase